MDTAENIPARVRSVREQHGLTQEAFANATAYTRSYVAQIESGMKIPGRSFLNELEDWEAKEKPDLRSSHDKDGRQFGEGYGGPASCNERELAKIIREFSRTWEEADDALMRCVHADQIFNCATEIRKRSQPRQAVH